MEHSAQELAGRGRERRLTGAELWHLRHALDAEILGVKKAQQYIEDIEDDEARDLLREHVGIHHRRIDLMLALLDAPADVTKQAKLLLQTGLQEEGTHHA